MQTNLMQCAAYGLSTDRLTPTPSTSAEILAALIHLFPKHNLRIGRWACALSFFGRPWRGLFWVEPVLLKHCMVWPPCCSSFSGSWQSSYSLRHLYVEQQLFFSDPQRVLCHEVMLNFQWPVWESESDNTKFNTPAPHSHLRPCNTNESHDTGERKWLIGPNLDIFT